MNTLQTARATVLGMALIAAAATGANAAQPAVDPIMVHAHHAYDGEVREVRVDYADLDIRTQAGATTLADRLAAASDDACGGRPNKDADQAKKTDFVECRTNAMFDAVRSVKSPVLRRVTNGGQARPLRPE